MKLTLNSDLTTRSARMNIAGDLDYGHTRALLDAVLELLAGDAALRELHLDFTDLGFVDSTGLSALLLIHRRLSRAGVRLHLDNRPARLDRILEITGLLEHLTAGEDDDSGRPDETEIG